LFNGNVHTAFGTAMHNTCEVFIKNKIVDFGKLLKFHLTKELGQVSDTILKAGTTVQQVGELLEPQGLDILKEFHSSFEEYFKEFKVLGVEEEFFEPIPFSNDKNLFFKGFIDLIVESGDKIHIIDHKTTSWGWNSRKKTNKLQVYQLILYKYFYSKKHGIPLDNIETHFCLLKRTAKKTKKVELFRVTSGKKRVDNCIDLTKKTLCSIQKNVFIKNKLSCEFCEFNNTKWCVK
jgi:ATP-dependent exoDNAse (exonuclease V) beta subunit